MEEYAGWLAAQLERLGDPVDLVGASGLRRFPGGAVADAVLVSIQRPVPGS